MPISDLSSFVELMCGLSLASVVIDNFNKQVLKISFDNKIKTIEKEASGLSYIFEYYFKNQKTVPDLFDKNFDQWTFMIKGKKKLQDLNNQKEALLKVKNFNQISLLAFMNGLFILVFIGFESNNFGIVPDSLLSSKYVYFSYYCVFYMLAQILNTRFENMREFVIKYSGIPIQFILISLLGVLFSIGHTLIFNGLQLPDTILKFLTVFILVFHYFLYIIRLKPISDELNKLLLDLKAFNLELTKQ